MKTFPAPAALNGEALLAELRAAGHKVDSLTLDPLENVLQVVTEADDSAVQSVLDAHSPEPDYGVPEEDRQLRMLRAKARDVAAGTGTFTPDQVQKILARLVLRATR